MWILTTDLPITSQSLCQLSYNSIYPVIPDMLRVYGFSRVPTVFPWCHGRIGRDATLPSRRLCGIFPGRGRRKTPAGCWEGGNRNGKKNGGNGMEAHPRYDRSEKSLLGCTSIFVFYNIKEIPQLVKTKCCLFYAVSIFFYHFSPFPFWVFSGFFYPSTNSATVPSPPIPFLLPGIYAFKRCPAFWAYHWPSFSSAHDHPQAVQTFLEIGGYVVRERCFSSPPH